ncbi:FKBP-type peptidyl-prolyl cis-trans isomerase [Tenacibaculum sp. SG-28]|uniref:FKBP-type peptidyl-prolyl cis-trans isomerase n=1 Tax=Tenacibaculum sp. SG-28 TaxID=754426 RepID=UPI000CF3B717|nr:peptidylprolyl isomerase [Tenacibaculum sp. SG-28]
MRITKIIAAAIVGLTIVSCSNGQLKTNSSLNSDIDSVSYAIGVDMATKITVNFKEADYDMFLQGFKSVLDSTDLKIDPKDANIVISNYFRKAQEDKMKLMQEKQEIEAIRKFGEYKKVNEDFLEKNKNNSGVVTTASGLQYSVLKEGEGEAPKESARVKVHYTGTLIDGTVFDSSVERNQPAEFGVTQVIKGWTEGLQLMKPGAKYKFFIPQELAYGYLQKGDKIKPFSTLVFEVELLEVK